MEDPDYIRRYVRENHNYINKGKIKYAGFSHDPDRPINSIVTRNTKKYNDDNNKYEFIKSYNEKDKTTRKINNFVELYTDKIIHYIYVGNNVYSCTRKILVCKKQIEGRYYLILRDP